MNSSMGAQLKGLLGTQLVPKQIGNEVFVAKKSSATPAKVVYNCLMKNSFDNPPVNQKESVSSLTKQQIKFEKGQGFVVILGCPRQMVPAGIQVIPVCGGNGGSQQPEESDHQSSFNNAKIDVGGLLARCTVDGINVNGNENYVSVYLNCTATPGGKGLDGWVSPYDSFVKKMLGQVWGTAVLSSNNGRTSLKLRGKATATETKLLFAIG